MIAPSPETTIDKVLTVAVLLGHLPEALSINKSGVDIRTLLNCSSRAVDNDSHALDAKVARKVEHAVVTSDRRSVGVGVVQFGHRDQEVARYLRQVDGVKLDVELSIRRRSSKCTERGVCSVRGGTILSGDLETNHAVTAINPTVLNGSGRGFAKERLSLPDVKPVRFFQRTSVAKTVVLKGLV